MQTIWFPFLAFRQTGTCQQYVNFVLLHIVQPITIQGSSQYCQETIWSLSGIPANWHTKTQYRLCLSTYRLTNESTIQRNSHTTKLYCHRLGWNICRGTKFPLCYCLPLSWNTRRKLNVLNLKLQYSMNSNDRNIFLVVHKNKK